MAQVEDNRKVIVVTGGGQGIGRAICLHFAARNFNVAVVDKNTDTAQETAQLCKLERVEARAIPCDLTDRAQVRKAFAQVDDAFGRAGVRVPIVILTLDPHTDTIERLQRFKAERKLPDHWHLIRGSDRDTQSLARKLLVHAAYDVGHIDHDVRIAVLDRDGKLTRSFSGWSFDAGSAVVQ